MEITISERKTLCEAIRFAVLQEESYMDAWHNDSEEDAVKDSKKRISKWKKLSDKIRVNKEI